MILLVCPGTRRGEKLGRGAAFPSCRSCGWERIAVCRARAVPEAIARLLLDFFMGFYSIIVFCVRLRRRGGGKQREEPRLLPAPKVIHVKTPFSSEQRLIAS